MATWEKIKDFYKDNKTAIISIGIGLFGIGVGWELKGLCDDIHDKKLTKEAMADWECKTLSDGTQISWTGYSLDEEQEKLDIEQQKAREDYPDKFEIMEEAISNLDLDLDDGEMWLIENGEPFMFKDSWYK